MKHNLRRFMSLALAVMMVVSLLPTAFAARESTGINLVPTEANAQTANYVCTWNIQDWVAWHEGNGNNTTKRDIVDPDHIFGNEEKGITGWADMLYKEARGDMIFLLDDGWDLPYGTTNKNAAEFGSMVLPTDKFPAGEWGDTPAERLKTLNEKMLEKGWAGTGLWICAQESKAYTEYYCNGNVEEYWKMRMEWSKYAGIAYWKVDWGNRMSDITWQYNLEKWAEEVYPELIIEHATGSTGGKSGEGNKRLSQDKIQAAVEYAAFSDVYRTYDVLDNLMTCITLDRVGEQLLAGYAQADSGESSAMGLLNAEDEMYIAASLGLTFGVMRFDPNLAEDTRNSGDEYFGQGTESRTYYAGGKAFTDTRATRTALDEVTRAAMWQRIAPAYAMGDYDVELANTYLDDSWRFRDGEKAWDGTGGTLTQRAPAAIARGIDLPTVTTSDGADIPYLTASRNPNGAISIATHARTYAEEGYTPIKTADVVLNAGDLTGKIGVFGYYGSLSMTFNQDLTGKTVLAQDLMGDEAVDITDEVEISGGTITIDGELLAQIGLSAGTEGDTSLPGLVIQIGEESDFAAAAETNERIESWDVNNASFEKFNYDAAYNETMKSVTGADWSRSGTNAASYITEGGHTGEYAAIHTSASAYSVTTYQLNRAVPAGVYTVSAWVKASANANAQLQTINTGSGTKSVDIPASEDWIKVVIDEVRVINNQIQVQVVSSNAAAGSYVIFDDVEVEWLRVLDETKIETDVILSFDFDDEDVVTDEEGNITGIKGTTLEGEVTADVMGVTFADGAAVYKDDNFDPSLRDSVGIKYAPAEETDDPLKTLDAGTGITVNMWINTSKTASENVVSPLFTYGHKQDNGQLGATAQLLEVPSGTDCLYYRNQNGSSGGFKFGTVGNKYTTGAWQFVSLVDDGSGTVTLYIDGAPVGTKSAGSDKAITGFAHDSYGPDVYYFGFVDYLDATSTDAHFEGQIDEITIYSGVLTGAQLENLYKEYYEPQTEIVLEVADAELGGQAVMNDGYVGWIGHGSDATGAEGTVTFTFNCKQADHWKMDVYYLSKASSTAGKSNVRDFDITVNGDPENVITITCPEGQSWNDPSLASVCTVESVELKKGENTLTFGNPDDNSPSLVRVVLTSLDAVDANAAAAVETMIMQKLSIVDNVEQLEAVRECRAAYDALTETQKALVSDEAYQKLLDAEELMDQWLDVPTEKAVLQGEDASVAPGAQVRVNITLSNADALLAVKGTDGTLSGVQFTLAGEGLTVKGFEPSETFAAYDWSTDENGRVVGFNLSMTDGGVAIADLGEEAVLGAVVLEAAAGFAGSDVTITAEMLSDEAGNPYTDAVDAEPFAIEATDAPFVNPFIDVFEDDWYFDSVLWAAENNITKGDGAENTFNPEGTVDRAQVVTFLYRAAGEPAIGADAVNPFTDVFEDDWYYNAVLWAVENDITVGTSATTFSPADPCTRSQVVTFLYRYDGSPEMTDAENPFIDLEEEWYIPAVVWAFENEITKGDGAENTFNPEGTCQRCQIVTFLYRYMVK